MKYDHHNIEYAKKHKIPCIMYCYDLWPDSLAAGGIGKNNPIFKFNEEVETTKETLAMVEYEKEGFWKRLLNKMFGKFNKANQTDEENDMLSFAQNILAWRKQTTAAHNGILTQFRPNKGVYIYVRESENDAFMVAVNLGKKRTDINLACYHEILDKW